MPDLRTLDRMEESTVKKLQTLGIRNTEMLLERGASPRGRREIAHELGVGESLVNHWVIYSNFFLVKGLTGAYVRMFMSSGICSLIELAKYDPGDLLAGLYAANAAKKNGVKLPTLNQLSEWVKQARNLPWKIIYDGMYCFG